MKAPRLAVTMGDPAGIGPELCLRLLHDSAGWSGNVPLVFGDAGILRRVAKRLDLPMPSQVMAVSELDSVEGPAIVDLAMSDAEAVEPGRVNAVTGRASYTYIEAAIDAALEGRVHGVVTGPVHKEALHLAGVPYPGHTEIFAAKTAADRACMMLTSDELTVSFVTTHIGYREVPEQLSTRRVQDVIELTAEAMAALRGRAPRIAVCGLNPHAGEHGLFGDGEEERIIEPAVQAARRQGVIIEGPLPPDTAFTADRRARTDAVVCMYHDQGHIPLKALAFDTAVNITLGLPMIRTSVDHGTALDIAWTGRANPLSLYRAFDLAARLALGRRPHAAHAGGVA